jgi:acetolactate synthase small subunit
MDIVVNLEGHALEQVIAQLDKLINVISIKEIVPNKTAPSVHDTQPDYQN